MRIGRIRAGVLGGMLAIASLPCALKCWAGTLDNLRSSASIRLAYREDAPPFSVKSASGQPKGYIVELCRAVAAQLTAQLNLAQLAVVYVPVTATNRFDAIRQGKADILCEATSETLARRKLVDFSIPTFVDGASLLIRRDGPTSLEAFAGHKVGVLGGTTTEQALRDSLKLGSIDATVVLANTHEEGIQMLESGTVSAYFADRAILQYLLMGSAAPEKLALADNYLTVELYALALPHGDEEFRLAVDTALSRIYRSGEIARIFHAGFGNVVEPSGMVKTLYSISGLQE